MVTTQLAINIMVFLVGIYGILKFDQNILVILMCIELMLLSANLNFITFSVYLDDFYGQLFALFVLTIAAAESAIGLAIIISFYRVAGTINIESATTLKG